MTAISRESLHSSCHRLARSRTLRGEVPPECIPTASQNLQSGLIRWADVKLNGAACPRPLECLIGLLLIIGWSEVLQHGVVLGVEGFQIRILGFSGSN